MDLDFESAPTRWLRRYARLVERSLNLGAGGHMVSLEPPVSLYLPLDDRLGRFPDRDVALVWDECDGWAAGVESRTGEALVVLAHLASDLLPAPRAVVRFVEQFYADELSGQPEPRPFRAVDDADDLPLRLSSFAAPALISLAPTMGVL